MRFPNLDLRPHRARFPVAVPAALALLGLALALGMVTASGPFASAHAETQPGRETRVVPARDGTSPPLTGMQQEIFDRARHNPVVVRKAPSDIDYRHVALLEDDGSLLTFLESGLFRTNTETIVQRFYASHGDDYDGLVIFSAGDFAGDVQPEAGFAFELNVANEIDGIGLPKFNEGPVLVPGLQRLRTIINMNDLGEYDEDPDALLSQFLNGASGMGILGQEFLHTVGAFVTADNADILGRGGLHWSFFFQSYGSPLEGNHWRDNGDGTFTTLQPATGFSELDLYLMGMISAAEVVQPMFTITHPQPDLLTEAGDATLPVAGVTLSGVRVDVGMDNITSIYGQRSPTSAEAPKDFRLAFILVTLQSHTPSEYDMEKIDEFRVQWEKMFHEQTRGLGTMTTELGDLPVIADFESEVFAGEPGLQVDFDNDSYGSIRGITWDFGDGNASNERHPSHVYHNTGSYTVQLDIQGVGDAATRTQEHFIRVGPTHTWFEDDFETEKGWTDDPLDSATSGRFLRIFPIGSWLRESIGNTLIEAPVAPNEDHTPNGNLAYVTGVAGTGAEIGVADVDGGVTSLVSPVIDLSQADDPVLEWHAWYVNNAGSSPGRDFFTVEVSDNGGQSWVQARAYRSTFDYWRRSQLRILDHVGLTDAFQVRFRVSDVSFGSIVEGAIDDVRIFDVDTQTPVQVSNFRSQAVDGVVTLQWEVQQHGGDRLLGIQVQRSRSAEGPFETIAHLAGTVDRYEDPLGSLTGPRWYRLVLQSESGSVVGPSIEAASRTARRSHLQSAVETEDGSVVLRYELARDSSVRFTLFDVRGRVVARRDLGQQTAGSHAQTWNRHDLRRRASARGVYLLQLETHDAVTTRKLLLRR